MSEYSGLRKLARRGLYLLLIFCFCLDATLGEAAISGYGDVAFSTANGIWSVPGPQTDLWPWIAGFIAIQGTLILAVFRLREPDTPQTLMG